MEIDYDAVGLKSGLEIHQQLDTGKLFCNCPSVLRKDEPDFTIKRRLHAVAGQSGKVDVAAAYQAEKNKEFTYQGYNDTTCLVELDEEPPHMINQEALKIALQISLMLNCKPIQVSQIMRKTVVDGSNTSGFQRTVMIAHDGWIETSEGKVGIESVCLEEDSARIVSHGNELGVFRLDRLGIPLVEIATKPEIKNPKQAKEVALAIGGILRTMKVKRGLGTIRQDVNLSIKGGSRIELKGFQDIRNIEIAIQIEVLRQQDLIKKGQSKAEVRRVLPDGRSEFLRPMPGAARMYPETDLPLLKISRKMMDDAKKKADNKGEEKIEGLNQEMMKLLFKTNKLEEYKELLHVIDNPQLIVKTLILYPKEIASREGKTLKTIEKTLNKDVLSHVLENLKKGKIVEHNLKHVLESIVKGKSHKEAVSVGKESLNVVEEKISNLIKSKPGLSTNAYMGLVMKDFKGKVSGKQASEIIGKYANKRKS